MAVATSVPLAGRRLVLPAVTGMGAVLGLMARTPEAYGLTFCPVALLTGVACPGCGMTRALAALAHGDLAAAWAFHPLSGLIAVEAAVALVWWAVYRAGLVRRWRSHQVAWILGLTGIALVGVWVLRLGQGTLPPV